MSEKYSKITGKEHCCPEMRDAIDDEFIDVEPDTIYQYTIKTQNDDQYLIFMVINYCPFCSKKLS